MEKSLNIGIIGGGITGLTLGYYLAKNRHKPLIFERDSDPGGLLSTIEIYESRLEKYYHHIFASDSYTLDLIKELGLLEQVDWLDGSIGLFYKGKTYSFSTPLDLLRFPYLGWLSKLRMGLGTIYLQKYQKWEKLKNKKAPEWIKKYMGNEVWQIIWQPLFQGKFGKYYQDIAMSWFWSRINARSAAKFKSRELLGYPTDSYQVIIDGLNDKIIENGGRIFLNSPIEKLVANEEKKIDLLTKGRRYSFDLVISTIAPPLLSRLIPENFNNFKKQLSEIFYIGNISTILILKEKLTGYYWTNILDRDIPFAGIIEHTNLVTPNHYRNKHIVYISHYISSDSDYFNIDNKELLRRYCGFLEKINPKIKSILEDVVIFKEAYAQPVITSDYPLDVLKFQTPVKNLYQLSMAHIFPEDRGINAAVREAKKLVNLILSHD